tara:strand:- start:1302 stop:1598 length:297 start_codon:yes stop_codon:yes gene_type:complete
MKDELNVYEYVLGQGLQTYFNPMKNPAPIHPDILKQMNQSFEVGDLVETSNRLVGIVKGVASQYEEGPMYISGANNTQYIVHVADTEKVLVGYSLKKI